MPRDDSALLLDMLVAARNAIQFGSNLTKDEFAASQLHQHAITRALEMIGQAAGKLTPEFQKAHPEFPWREMIAMRNYRVHEYFRIDLETVWKTTAEDVPKLIPLLEALLPPER